MEATTNVMANVAVAAAELAAPPVLLSETLPASGILTSSIKKNKNEIEFKLISL